jgi:hypothetical protein
MLHILPINHVATIVTIDFKSVLPSAEAVGCVVVELRWDPQLHALTELSGKISCANGQHQVQNPLATHLAVLPPGHWSMLVDAAPSRVVACEPIIDDADLPWWQRAVGVTPARLHRASNIRIGVIDRIFERRDNLLHVRLIDTDAHVAMVMRLLGGTRYVTHGELVTQVLGGRGPDGFRGIAQDAEILFADATLIRNKRLIGDAVDPARIVEAIEVLSMNHEADIINISCGFSEQDFKNQDSFDGFELDLLAAVERAADVGCICVCAGGNADALPPPLPARMDEVVGVGGIGMCGVAPARAWMSLQERDASANGGMGSAVAGVGTFFHDGGMSSGPGIDVAAPSIGVVLKPHPDVVADYRGTSFSSPIAAGVFACNLAKDPIYRGLPRGRSRFNRAWKVLLHATYSLGLNPLQVGDGLPHLG